MAIKAKISDSTSGPSQVSVTVPAQVQVDINNTDDLSEGSTNLYYTEARANEDIVSQLQDIQSTGLATLLNGDINISPDGTGNVNITSNILLTGAGKNIVFEGDTADSFETTLTVTDPTADRTITLPNATDTLVGKATTDTLTNKTLTTPIITEIDSGSTITLDAETDIVLDARGGDIYFKDNGTTFGSVTNAGGNLTIKNGATTALTFSGANTTVVGNLTVDGTTTFTGGSITLGDAATDTIAFTGTITGNLVFEGSTVDSFETTLAPGNPTGDITLSLPSTATDTLVAKNTTDTLTNKTLTTPTINTINATTFTVNASADIVLDADGADIKLKDGGTNFGRFTNSGGELVIKSGSSATTAATFSGANTTLAGTVNSGAITSTGIVTGSFFVATSGSIIFEGTTDDSFETTLQVVDPDVDRTILLPNASDTLIGKATTDTLTNKSIDLGTNTLTGSVAEFNAALQSESFTTLTGSETLTNKILTSPVINTPTVGTSLTLLTAGTIIFEGATADSFETTLTVTDPTVDRTLTLPNATDTLIGKATTDTLTNKTLTSPVLNTSVSGTAFLDEDNMASNSATKLASQKSIKAYVDTVMLTEDTLAEMNDTNITSPADASLLLYDTGTSTWRDGAMSGDATIGDTGAITFTTVNSNVGQFGSATAIPVVTVNAKGLVTAVATSSITTSLTIGADTGSNDAVALANDVLDISGGSNITTTVSNNDISVALDPSPVITTIVFEGATADSFETTLTVVDPTADRTITLPNESFKIASFENMVVANGDNSTVNFTVATGYHLNQFLVTLNGVIQEPTADFTYSGSTLTMGAAPITGDRLTIRY
jgi:hypothetical protein